jgi:hypothetical protein
MNYKAPDNSLHVIEPQFAYLLPAGSVAITAEEAETLRPKSAAPTYAELRAAAYPPLLDLIDGLVKDDAAQIQRYKDACLAVKQQYPKPE